MKKIKLTQAELLDKLHHARDAGNQASEDYQQAMYDDWFERGYAALYSTEYADLQFRIRSELVVPSSRRAAFAGYHDGVQQRIANAGGGSGRTETP